jgi:hypothetical protein
LTNITKRYTDLGIRFPTWKFCIFLRRKIVDNTILSSPDMPINVRDLIDVVHLPTGRKFQVGFDNFRRGKFRCAYK